MARNCHKVCKRQWAKWSKSEQGWFNRMWYRVYNVHLPTGISMNQKQMNVLRFNICWEVAEMHKAWR